MLTICRDPAAVQTTSLQAQGPFPAPSVQQMVDLLTMEVQALRTLVNRGLQVSRVDPALPLLPIIAQRASKYLGFDASGNPIAIAPNNASGLAVTSTGSTTPRLLADRFAEVVYVKDFGAAGDGVTNDSLLRSSPLSNTAGSSGTLETPVRLVFEPGSYRITFAKGQSNTDPFHQTNAKSWYVFELGAIPGGWLQNTLVGQPDQTSWFFAIEGLGQRRGCCMMAMQTPWLMSVNGAATTSYMKIDMKNIAVIQYATDTVARHGLSFDYMLFFNHQDISTSGFLYGVGMQYRRLERGNVINRSSILCMRGLVLGDPDATDPSLCSCNEVNFYRDSILYCGANLSLAQTATMGFAEIWQAQGVNFYGTSWKANDSAMLIVSAINCIVDNAYFENNGPPINGACTSISSLSGGTGYTNGETVYVRASDLSGAFATAVATTSGGVITALSGFTGYSDASNFGFTTGTACTITGVTSGATNATCNAVVAGLSQNWGLINHVVFNPLIAPANANYGFGGPYIDNFIFRCAQIQYEGVLFRASMTKQIGRLTFENTNWQQPGGVSGLHYVSGEEAYIESIKFRGGAIVYADFTYLQQNTVDGTTYAWIAGFLTRKLPLIIETNKGGRFGLEPRISGCAWEYTSPVISNITGDGGTIGLLTYDTPSTSMMIPMSTWALVLSPRR